MNNTDEVNRSRYAQMQSTLLNNTGSSLQSNPPNKMNLLGKFALLEELTFKIEGETHALTAASRESSRVVEQMKRVVAEKELKEYKQNCWEEVKKYERVVAYGVAENERRTEQLQSKGRKLTDSTQQLKQVVASLHSRINKLQNILGFYNGAEIVSNY